MKFNLHLHKMRVENTNPIQYYLKWGGEEIVLNNFIGKRISLSYTGRINCLNCGGITKKSYGQGYCYKCFSTLARCDMCIMKPETCHFAEGTCREPTWAESNCMLEHVIYLANSSGLKVGITRGTQVPTRWIDQGAVHAIVIGKAIDRLNSGLIEVEMKKYVADKTNWRKMLSNQIAPIDLKSRRDELHQHWIAGNKVIKYTGAEEYKFVYPVEEFPEKIVSKNFDKLSLVEGLFLGIKGQYLIMDTGVLNIRKFGGYQILLDVAD